MQALIAYLDELIAQSVRSPLLDRVGRRFADLCIPLRVQPDDAEPRPPRDLDALEPELRLVLLRGCPGSGKSAWLRHITAEDRPCFPGAARARRLAGSGRATGPAERT
jgi:hypothetical protein